MKKTGDEYFDSEEFRDLLNTYEQSRNEGTPVFLDADELAEIADYYQFTGHDSQAEEAIAMALSLSPGAIAPLTYRIHQALYKGDTQTAWEMLNQVTDTDEPDYVYDKAEILITEGKTDEADDYLRDCLNNLPLDEQQDFIVDVANIFTENGLPERAMLWMARGKSENTPDFKELMARTLFGLGKYKESERIFNELLDIDPFSIDYWNAMASAQFMGEDYKGALQSSEFAIAIDPHDPNALIAKANSLYRLGNNEESLKFYQRYSKEMPDDEFALLHQGNCMICMGETKEALGVLHQALEKAGDDSPYLYDIYHELAFAYSYNGEHDKAIDYLNKTDEMDCDHVSTEVIKGHIMLSAGRTGEAEQYFRNAIAASKEPRQTLLQIIVSFYDNRYLNSAYKLFKDYFKYPFDEKNSEGYAYMALCCHDLKKQKEFLLYLKKACSTNPRSCKTVLGHLFPEELEPEEYYNYIKEKMNI